jgi:hypothetical protein
MDILITLSALCLLMLVAYRGFSVILFAPVAALLAVLLTDPVLVPPFFSGIYMEKLVGFLKPYFPVFLLGAVLGKLIELGNQMRFSQGLSETGGLERAAVQHASVENQGRIAVANVQLGSLAVTRRIRFAQQVVLWQRTIGRQTTFWAPPSMGDPTLERPVKGRTVGTGLATRHDFFDEP